MKHFWFYALLLGSLFAASHSSFAQTPPPVFPFDSLSDETTWKATLKRKPATSLLMGTFQVRFEETKLDDVLRAASAGKIWSQGDAATSITWLCYTNLSATRVERVWIMSGEMGGGEYVTDVRAELLPNGSATADCPALPDKLKPLSLDNQLWLDVPEGAAVEKLGVPSFQKDAWRVYSFEGKVPGKCEGGFDLTNTLMLRVQDGRVNSLGAFHITSC
jgi:hypothetical protein